MSNHHQKDPYKTFMTNLLPNASTLEIAAEVLLCIINCPKLIALLADPLLLMSKHVTTAKNGGLLAILRLPC